MQEVSQGQEMTLRHHRITAGLAWDIGQGRKVDLDTSVVAIDNYGNILIDETIYYGNLVNTNASIQHSGDETTGELKGDDESLLINLDCIPSHVTTLYFLLTVATPGMTFEDVKSACVRLLSTDENTGICRYVPSSMGQNSALFLARLSCCPDSLNKI